MPRHVVDTVGRKNLRDQLKVFKAAKDITVLHRTLKEDEFYPAHDHRTESPKYKVVHDKLVGEMDLPCLSCGVKKSVLDDPVKRKDPKLNPYGAKQMETHHHITEWALANAVDTAKFNSMILPNLARAHPDRQDYKTPFTDQQVRDWVDHDENNLWVLCDVHHRAPLLGIHWITYPIWGPQNLLNDAFEDFVRKQIQQDRGAESSGGGTSVSKPPAKKRSPARRKRTPPARRKSTSRR